MNIQKLMKGSKEDPKNIAKETLANLIGLVVAGMDEVTISDLTDLLKREKFECVDGYILALSRLVQHPVAWELIQKAYGEIGQPVPSRYAPLFGQTIQQKIPQSRWSVSG